MIKILNRALVNMAVISGIMMVGFVASSQAQTYQYSQPPGTAKTPAVFPTQPNYDSVFARGADGRPMHTATRSMSPNRDLNERANRLFEIGSDALEDGDRSSACSAFKGAQRLFKRSDNPTMEDESAAMAQQACAKNS